mgnify:CR=1 FL=1
MARDPRTYTPKKAGEEIGASADTIRRYCQLYRRHLSPGAAPEAGRARVLTAVDVYLLKVAKKATEAGSTVEEVDDILATIAIPEEIVTDDEDNQVVETLPATVESAVSESALALLRQMSATLERLEARDRRFDQLAEEIATIKRVMESPPQSAPVEVSRPASPWSAYLPYIVAVAVVAGVILVVALIVALLR